MSFDDPNADDTPFTPETLRGYASHIEELRQKLLFRTDETGADPHAEQMFLTALGFLEVAHRMMSTAALTQKNAVENSR